MRHRTCFVIALGTFLAAVSRATPAELPSGPGLDERLRDYRGKGEVTVALEEGPNAGPVALTIQMEQTFCKPGTILLNLSLFGDGLRQSFLTEPGMEQSYNPVQGIVVEKRYKNYETAPKNPLIALQASMYDLGCKVRSAESRRTTGEETLLGFACDIVELQSREIFEDLPSSGILSGDRGALLRSGRTRVWVAREYGLPVKIEIYTSSPKPSMSVAFTELKVNTGVAVGDLRLEVPQGTRKVSVTADLKDPKWEEKMDAELRQLLEAAAPAPAGGS